MAGSATYDRAIGEFDAALRLNPKLRPCLCHPRQCAIDHGKLRPRDRKLRPGDPARSERRDKLCQAAPAPIAPKAIPTAPSPITARRCGSIPRGAAAFTERGIALADKGDHDRAIAD